MASIEISDFIKYNSLNVPQLLTRNIGAGFTFTPRGNLGPGPSTLLLILLAIFDTYHDFGGERGDADFFNKVVAKFLMLNEQTTTNIDETNSYKDVFSFILSRKNLNFYGPGSYENKVASLFENVVSLQKAVTTITYSEIIDNVTLVGTQTFTFEPDFIAKVIASNGSLNIIPSLSENLTFERFICTYGDDGDTKRNQALLKIGNFIKWYLHSPSLESVDIIDQIRITADAGFFHVGKIMSVSGSGGIPYITVPNILDSASTSISKLDPNADIEYEELEEDLVYPIYSNYFSSSIYFICYIVNQSKKFGVDSPFCFSLCIFNIELLNGMNPDLNVSNAINYIRNNVWNSEDPDYNAALRNIKLAIDTYPGMVVRYYFGEVERDLMIETSKCGTCGAGVNYIGRAFSKIYSARNDVNIGTLKSNLEQHFNGLITEEKLNSRIPISDGRILKLINQNATNIINADDILNLYYLLADYKRTGDYQQIYTILSKIKETGTNDGNYTFSTGDELAALLSRLLGLPTIWQVGSTGRTTLYRNTYFSSTQEQQHENRMERLRTEINKEFIQNRTELTVLINFLKLYRSLNSLKETIKSIYQTEQNYFSKLLLINLIYVLNGLMETANNIFLMFPELQKNISINTTSDKEEDLTTYLALQKTAKNQIQTFIVEIIRYFPNFVDYSDSVIASFDATNNYFAAPSTTGITIPLLNLKFKNKKLIIPQKAKKANDLLVKFNELTLQATRRPRPVYFNNNEVDLFKNLLTDFFENLECVDLANEKIDFSQLFPSSPPTSIYLKPLENLFTSVETKVLEREVVYNEQMNDQIDSSLVGGAPSVFKRGDKVVHNKKIYRYFSKDDETHSIIKNFSGKNFKVITTELTPLLDNSRKHDHSRQHLRHTNRLISRIQGRRYVHEKFKEILSNIVNKCELFIKDTFYDYGKPVKSINIDDVCALSYKYDSLDFCYNLFFGNETDLGLLNKLTELSLSLDDMTLISMLQEYDSGYTVRILLYLLLDLLRRHTTPGSSYNFDYENIRTEFYSDADLAKIISLIPDPYPYMASSIFGSSNPPEYLLYVEPFLLIISIGSIFKKVKFLFFSELSEMSPTIGANYFSNRFYSRFVTVLYLSYRLHIINNNSTYDTNFKQIKMSETLQIFAFGNPPKKGGSKIIYKNKTKKRVQKRKSRKVKKSKKQIRKTYRKK